MIVVSAFNPDSVLAEDDALHKDEPFDGVDIIAIIPQGEDGDDTPMAEARHIASEWMDSHPNHKVCIDSLSVTL